MLIKLLKYDIKSTAKIFLFMSTIMLGFCLLAAIGSLVKHEIILTIILVPAVLASIAYIFVLFVICLLHFYNHISGRESYLMFTLPVKTHTLILSKYLSTLFWGIFTVAMLCLFWLGAAEFFLLRPFSYSLYTIFGANLNGSIDIFYFLFIIVAQYAIYLIPMTGFFICLINLPALKNRNRGLPAAIIGWIAAGQIIGIIQVAILFLLLWLGGDLDILLNDNLNDVQAATDFIRNAFNIILITFLFFGAAFYAGMVRITAKHRSI